MSVYVVKISNDENIQKILNLQKFTHDGINLFENEIALGDPVFIYFGGDKAQVSWETGLAAVGRIAKSPYDNGYLKNNFKIDIQPLHVLTSPIPQIESKLHVKLSRMLWGAPYFGANHFPTQAIQKMKNDDATFASGELYSEYAPDSIDILKSLGVYDSSKIPTSSVGEHAPINLPNKELTDIVEAFLSDSKNANLKISSDTVKRLISSLLSKRFTILTGLSGSGKTKLAHAFAAWISPTIGNKDPFSTGNKIGKKYTVTTSDKISVEFSNNEDLDEGQLVALPRGLIKEWADYIEVNALDRDMQAQQMRELIKPTSKYAKHLNNFETHLKPAAIALLDYKNETEVLDCFRIIPVGADWTSNENILGYQDALQPAFYRKPSSGALDLILRADKDPGRPYFLILDEMNLSHVERYFADILSSIESGQPITLHSASEPLVSYIGDPLPVPATIQLPENLFIIGTVNIDETTYMFSPKVLDRANVLEFRPTIGDISEFLQSPSRVKMEPLAGLGAQYGNAIVKASNEDISLEAQLVAVSDGDVDKALKQHELLNSLLVKLFSELEPIGAEFGYRTAMEITRFVCFHALLTTNSDWKLSDALDAQVVQKLMPKLHGSDRKLRPVLEKLQTFCSDNKLNLSLEKTNRMLDRLKDGFTSFAEA